MLFTVIDNINSDAIETDAIVYITGAASKTSSGQYNVNENYAEATNNGKPVNIGMSIPKVLNTARDVSNLQICFICALDIAVSSKCESILFPYMKYDRPLNGVVDIMEKAITQYAQSQPNNLKVFLICGKYQFNSKPKTIHKNSVSNVAPEARRETWQINKGINGAPRVETAGPAVRRRRPAPIVHIDKAASAINTEAPNISKNNADIDADCPVDYVGRASVMQVMAPERIGVTTPESEKAAEPEPAIINVYAAGPEIAYNAAEERADEQLGVVENVRADEQLGVVENVRTDEQLGAETEAEVATERTNEPLGAESEAEVATERADESPEAETETEVATERADESPGVAENMSADVFSYASAAVAQVDAKAEAAVRKPERIWVRGKEFNAAIIGGRFVLGKPAGTFVQTPKPARQMSRSRHKDDLAADIARVGDLLILAASLRGPMHYSSSTVRQDSYAIGAIKNENDAEWLIAVVADGVSEADQAHLLAEYISRQTVLFIKDELRGKSANVGLTSFDWVKVSRKIVAASQGFCKKQARAAVNKNFDPESLTSAQLLRRWASTLEFAVVKASGTGKRPFVSVSVAGDGAVYILNADLGWNAVKYDHKKTGAIASNAVIALPADPGPPVVTHGSLEFGDQLFITTDGLGDIIGNGATALGGFLQRELPECRSLVSYLQALDVSLYQADDDRTGVLIKEQSWPR